MQTDFERYADEIRGGLKTSPFLNCFQPLDCFREEEAKWIIPGWLPQEQITLLAADGGIGKTSLWVNILAALSSGGQCILDPPDLERSPMRVAFCTTEDSVSKKLKRRLREAGAAEENVLTMNNAAARNGELRGFKFGTALMEEFIRHFRPAVCVFDPVQGFIPPEVNMGSRNAMRDCMAPLIALGEEVGTSFLIICHTNKRKGAAGRDRIADSADLWDVARCVWMSGFTEERGIRYLSNEKNNYAPPQKTLLFSLKGEGQVRYEGVSEKRDREYMAAYAASFPRPKRGECKDWVLRRLEAGGQMRLGDLERDALQAGYAEHTYRRAKDELVKIDKLARTWSTGYGNQKTWHIALALPSDGDTWASKGEKP